MVAKSKTLARETIRRQMYSAVDAALGELTKCPKKRSKK
jgi:hypothetical protein